MLKHFMHPEPSPTVRAESVRPEPARRPFTTAHAAEPRHETEPDSAPAADVGNKLIVGPNIKLKGSEITDCEILVVEGRVEAAMHSRDIRIANGGVFAGKAVIDVAEVHGCFEGELTARKRLVIHATGRVTGTIRYGAMMIAEGGTLAGDVAMLDAGARVSADKPGGEKQANDETTSTTDASPGDKPTNEKRPALARA